MQLEDIENTGENVLFKLKKQTEQLKIDKNHVEETKKKTNISNKMIKSIRWLLFF